MNKEAEMERAEDEERQDLAEVWGSLAEVPFSPDVKAEALKQEVGMHAKNLRQLNVDYAKQLDRLAERGKDKISQKEFEMWEGDFAYEWRLAEGAADKMHCSLTDRIEAEMPMVAYRPRTVGEPYEKDLRRTVEAQAGLFYWDRARDLRIAMREAGGDYAPIRDFEETVALHLSYKGKAVEGERDMLLGEDGTWSKSDAETVDRERTKVHNAVIEKLNGLNALAEQYGTKRFTPRDFVPSSAIDKRMQTPDVALRMRYDRDIVEEYYAWAGMEK